MASEQEITQWLSKLVVGDERTTEIIWRQYIDRLQRLARRRLGALPRRVADEEDVALSAMNSFFQGAEQGRFPKLENRDDLWKLLSTITARKVIAQQRRMFAEKRGAGQVRGESVFQRTRDASQAGFAGFSEEEATPEATAQLAESIERLLGKLEDDSLKLVALLRLKGFSNDEIAGRLPCTTRTVERKLHRIREIWDENLETA
ncbi:MAG: hypothetical protein KDA37_18140 [Planctomycetales bacterium]|nr:hypothetical protein [Planctomycetales bacterium]